MKFVSIFTFDPAVATPPDEAAIGTLIVELMQSGQLVDTGGTLPEGLSLRVRKGGGRTTVTDGPFTETKEVVGGFAVLNVDSKHEAVELTGRFLDLMGTGACELHQVGETPNPAQ